MNLLMNILMKKTNTEFKTIIVASAFLALLATAENGAGAAAGNANNSLKISEFMMAPASSWVPGVASATSNVTITEEYSSTDKKLGLRVIHLPASNKGSKTGAVNLAASGVIQSGDILLSFRPEWDQTLAYAHMQLGISHAAMAFVVTEGNSKFVHSLETPINYSSPLNSSHHYGDLNAIHIIRPTLSAQQKTNLSKWARKVLQNQARYGFFTDYGKPWYKRAAGRTPKDQIKELAKVTLNGGRIDTYCSEFVWTFLGLRDCNPDPEAYSAGCEDPIFATSSGALTGLSPGLGTNTGLIQGPESALANGGKSAAEKTAQLTQNAFVDILRSPDQLAGRMSSGHRAVAEANSGLMKSINQQYYAAGEPAQVAAGINAQVVENFSPTSFMIRSNAGQDGLKYVGTVVFDK